MPEKGEKNLKRIKNAGINPGQPAGNGWEKKTKKTLGRPSEKDRKKKKTKPCY
jgi:hypothetical protein